MNYLPVEPSTLCSGSFKMNQFSPYHTAEPQHPGLAPAVYSVPLMTVNKYAYIPIRRLTAQAVVTKVLF